MRENGVILYFILVLSVLASCQKDVAIREKSVGEVPNHFPEIEYPEDNHFSPERWQLGKRLFFDPVMSRDSSISCASCHKPELAFSDNRAFSPGVDDRPGTRNSPSLTNVAYHPYLTREGGVPTLEMQILVPIQEHNEFDFNILEIGKRLRADSTYIEMSHAAYNREPDFYVITRALANYERTLISGNSAYDQYLNGDEIALNPTQLAGKRLFFSERTHCSECHSGFNFTNYAFENNGLYMEYEDVGRFRLTSLDSDMARFKVPSLRNVGVTAPYMHDGSLNTLKEVIVHYNSGGKFHPNKSEFIQPLQLSEKEMSELEAFLHTLTDYQFISNPEFKP